MIFLMFSLPTGLIEVFIARKYSRPLNKSTSKDNGTMFYIFFTIICSQTFTAHYIQDGRGAKIIDEGFIKYFLWMPAGILVYVLGFLIRKQAIQQLGQWFTTIVHTSENQKLIDSGWYSRMRHPSYTGVLMYFSGLTILLNNWLGVITIMLPVLLIFNYRIYVEENALVEHFGTEYENYRKKVSNKIFPRL